MHLSIWYDDPGMEVVKKRLEDLSRDIPRISKGRIYGRMIAAQRRITKMPPLWKGKLPKGWFKSERQRKFVMALVRGGRVPYQRTGRYSAGWQLKNITDGYSLETHVPYSRWVGGDLDGHNQARIHRGRWSIAADVMREEIEKLPKDIEGGITASFGGLWGW